MPRWAVIAVVAAAPLALLGTVLKAPIASALPYPRCGSANGWYINVIGATSCEFAANVARSIDPSTPIEGQFRVQAFSPVTGLSYDLGCFNASQLAKQALAYECGYVSADRSGGGAIYLWRN